MRNAWRIYGLALPFAGLLLAGCKSAPELTRQSAQAMIQAHYDSLSPVSPNILVNDDGMKMGVTAKYWDRSKAYPNKYWADFKLTPNGKKAVKLPSGNDIIEWHPDTPGDPHYTVVVTPLQANHLKATNVGEPEDELGGTKAVDLEEVTSMEGVPDPLQSMARGTSTKISVHRTATFELENGAWKLKAIV